MSDEPPPPPPPPDLHVDHHVRRRSTSEECLLGAPESNTDNLGAPESNTDNTRNHHEQQRQAVFETPAARAVEGDLCDLKEESSIDGYFLLSTPEQEQTPPPMAPHQPEQQAADRDEDGGGEEEDAKPPAVIEDQQSLVEVQDFSEAAATTTATVGTIGSTQSRQHEDLIHSISPHDQQGATLSTQEVQGSATKSQWQLQSSSSAPTATKTAIQDPRPSAVQNYSHDPSLTAPNDSCSTSATTTATATPFVAAAPPQLDTAQGPSYSSTMMMMTTPPPPPTPPMTAGEPATATESQDLAPAIASNNFRQHHPQQHQQQTQATTPRIFAPENQTTDAGRINATPDRSIASYSSYESETGETFHHSAVELRERRNRGQIQLQGPVRPAGGATLHLDLDPHDSGEEEEEEIEGKPEQESDQQPKQESGKIVFPVYSKSGLNEQGGNKVPSTQEPQQQQQWREEDSLAAASRHDGGGGLEESASVTEEDSSGRNNSHHDGLVQEEDALCLETHKTHSVSSTSEEESRNMDLSAMSKRSTSPQNNPSVGSNPFELQSTVTSTITTTAALPRPEQPCGKAAPTDGGAVTLEKMSGAAVEGQRRLSTSNDDASDDDGGGGEFSLGGTNLTAPADVKDQEKHHTSQESSPNKHPKESITTTTGTMQVDSRVGSNSNLERLMTASSSCGVLSKDCASGSGFPEEETALFQQETYPEDAPTADGQETIESGDSSSNGNEQRQQSAQSAARNVVGCSHHQGTGLFQSFSSPIHRNTSVHNEPEDLVEFGGGVASDGYDIDAKADDKSVDDKSTHGIESVEFVPGVSKQQQAADVQ